MDTDEHGRQMLMNMALESHGYAFNGLQYLN